MSKKSWLGVVILLLLALLVLTSRVLGHQVSWPDLGLSRTFTFDFKSLNIKVSRNLEKITLSRLAGRDGIYGIYVENLQSGEKYYYNESMNFPSASLYKLVVMAAIMQEVENGYLSLEDTVSSTKSHLTDVFGGVDYGYEDAPQSLGYTVDEALTRVGRVSDNFAAIMLSEKARRIWQAAGLDGDALAETAKSLGMSSTDFSEEGTVTTTPADIATYFKALYRGQVVSPTSSQKISGYLSGSQINNRIPALLPKEVKVVHKTGELARLRHDAGIVYLEGNPYVIILMAQDLPDEEEGIDTLAKISRDVYDYFAAQVTPTVQPNTSGPTEN